MARNVGDFVVEWIFLYAPAEDFPDEKGTHTHLLYEHVARSTFNGPNTAIDSV